VKKIIKSTIILRIFLRISIICCNFVRFFDGRANCARARSVRFNMKGIGGRRSFYFEQSGLSTFYFLLKAKTIATIPPRPRGGRVIKEDPHRINDKIRGVAQVRLIGDNVEQGIYSFQQAMKIADDQNLDLVEIAATANPPVCRVIDYQKFLYAQKKKQKEAKANQKKQEVKEIRFGPQTDDHDYNFKLKHAQEFLKEGNKVKAYVFFRGRSIVFKEQGELLLARFAADLEEYGKADNVPNLEGKRMIMFVSPKSQKG